MLDVIKGLLYKSLYAIRPDMKDYIRSCLEGEISDIEREILEIYIRNENVSQSYNVPLCQDTGLVTVYLSHDIAKNITVNELEKEIASYMKTLNMRNSQVTSPLVHENMGDNQIPFIKIISSWQDMVGVQVSGAGSELQGFVLTFTGSSTTKDIIHAIVPEVIRRFPKSCPPVMIGVGMGGTLADAALLSKLALFRKIGQFHSDEVVSQFERDLLSAIREQSDRGAQGIVGGQCGVAHVAAEYVPSHIAGFHVAVSFQCYLTRSWWSHV
ncbi:MAG: fumarate hydratase [Dictyoglomi bacterium]|nr:fumarate hydratase [Dictyoglomota bacterium]